MKFIRLIGLWVIMGCSIEGWAQQADHFIYLQSDTKQPFFVKLGATASPLASSSSGYLILPRVSQGSLSFWVGFPDNSAPEQHFTVSVGADKGYLLKRFPEKGWALYDLQELTLTYATAPDSVKTPSVPDTTGKGHAPDSAGHLADSAGQAPAQSQASAAPGTTAPAASTPAVSTPVTPAPATPDTVPPTAAQKADAFGDALVAVTQDSSLRNVKVIKRTPQVVPPVAAPLPSGGAASIVLVSRQVADDGVHLVYTDRQASGGVDTVQVLMPKGTSAATAAVPAGTSPAVDSQAVAQTGTAPDTTPATTPVTVQGTPVTAPTTPVTAPATPVTTLPAAGSTAAVPTGDSAKSGGAPTTDTTAVSAVNQSVTPADTTHAFNPATTVRSGKTKDTSNYVVPVFKQDGGTSANTGSSQSLAAGFGVQPTTAAGTATAPAGAATTPAGSAGGSKGLQLTNANCNHVAGDDEYLKLRKRMASESDVDRMIELAKKAFKKSCFTTEQIRNLTFLFNLEDGRYKFVEEAYPFVSDSYNFKSLQALFSSVYFVNRFKALVER